MKQDELLAGIQSADQHLKKARAELVAEREFGRPIGVESVVGVGSLTASSSVTEVDGVQVRAFAGVLRKQP